MTETERRIRTLEASFALSAEAEAAAQGVDIVPHIAPVYYDLHEDIKNAAHQFYNLPGGRGSCKSSFVALEIVEGVMKDKTGNSNAIALRRTANTLRDSCYSQIAWAIDLLGVGGLWRGSVTPLSWTYTPTGAQIVFRGLDEPSKLKSIRPRKGVFRFVWFEEFSELPGENFARNVLQSVVRGKGQFAVFRSFNPPQSLSNWTNTFIERQDSRAITLRTNYLDIPPDWLGEVFIGEAEHLKAINATAYEHEYLGIPTGTGGEVFPNIEVREISDEEAETFSYIYHGLDFGFSIDPAVFMRVAYDRQRDTVYLLDEIHKKHWSNKQMADEIKRRGYDKGGTAFHSLFHGTIAEEKKAVTCDCAEPKSIHDLQAEGLKAIGCRKYPGCVMYRIKWLQHRRIVIDPNRTPNAYKEFSEYEYTRTKDGEYLADVPDINNHCIDATCYALDNIINSRKDPA